eukprot:Em0011g327a
MEVVLQDSFERTPGTTDKAHAAKLLNAFGIDTNNDDNRVRPEHFCPRALDSGMHRKIHYKCGTAPFQWEMHSDQECKPITFMHVTNAHNPTTTVCTRTLKSRCSELQDIRRIVSGGEPSALLQSEVLSLSDEERKSLLKEAGISDEIKIGPAEVLAIKVGLAIPWNKIRLLRRIVGDNIQGELAPFSFTLTSGGEELQAAPLVFIPNLIQKNSDDTFANNTKLSIYSAVLDGVTTAACSYINTFVGADFRINCTDPAEVSITLTALGLVQDITNTDNSLPSVDCLDSCQWIKQNIPEELSTLTSNLAYCR